MWSGPALAIPTCFSLPRRHVCVSLNKKIPIVKVKPNVVIIKPSRGFTSVSFPFCLDQVIRNEYFRHQPNE
jgi:hypothetical protein